VTTSRALRLLAAGAAALVAGAGAWIVVGNAYAVRREAAAERAFEATFGPRAALEAKYAAAGSNAEAREAETLARALGSDVSLGTRESRKKVVDGFSEKERAAVMDYVTAQLVRPDDSVSAPRPEAAATLEARRAALTTFEEFLVSSPSPKWAFDTRVDRDARLEPNGLGHIRVQRLLIADALAASARGDSAGGQRALEASWKLNEGLVPRPDIVSQLIAVAVARYEAGALRGVGARSDVWAPRLAAMGARARLVDALVLDHPRSTDMAAHYRRVRPEGVGWWVHNFVSLLEEPYARLADASYSDAWRRALTELRDEPAFRERAPDPKPGWNTTAILMSIALPNIRNSFERADRLALDAELTAKILRVKDARRAQGAWPQPSAEISSSRFSGLSWNYAVDGGVMTIALARALPKPPSPFVLPTSFSSRLPAS
jgi:hypothetical protein